MHTFGAELPLWTTLPFAGLLLCIAILPLAVPHFWESNLNKGAVAALFALPVLLYFPAAFGTEGVHQLLGSAFDYVSFILLLASLFVITGGIHVSGSLSGTPLLNTMFLAAGGLIANFIGTTGASALLVRPLLRANAPRERKSHIFVFFIFIVSNCGGLLAPLGDPPLFLGFLKGVPFTWTLGLWRPWLLVNGTLLALFNVWDRLLFKREQPELRGPRLKEGTRHAPVQIRGKRNLLFLTGIVATIYAAGKGIGTGGSAWPMGLQEGLMLAIASAAWRATHHEHRRSNNFTFGPIVEVAALFAGIFVTMRPALLLLNARALEVGLREPWQFFWAAGALSSFLDNAPTYLTFAAAASGLHGIPLEGKYLAALLSKGSATKEVLGAISTGAVFMGANSYIGNGPNFMVKAIAEENGVTMPSFFGYMAYSCGILLPLFVIVTFIVFR
jgi:Na+/H+ antiporter NhaD/arsenite permease-like protein